MKWSRLLHRPRLRRWLRRLAAEADEWMYIWMHGLHKQNREAERETETETERENGVNIKRRLEWRMFLLQLLQLLLLMLVAVVVVGPLETVVVVVSVVVFAYFLFLCSCLAFYVRRDVFLTSQYEWCERSADNSKYSEATSGWMGVWWQKTQAKQHGRGGGEV